MSPNVISWTNKSALWTKRNCKKKSSNKFLLRPVVLPCEGISNRVSFVASIHANQLGGTVEAPDSVVFQEFVQSKFLKKIVFPVRTSFGVMAKWRVALLCSRRPVTWRPCSRRRSSNRCKCQQWRRPWQRPGSTCRPGCTREPSIWRSRATAAALDRRFRGKELGRSANLKHKDLRFKPKSVSASFSRLWRPTLLRLGPVLDAVVLVVDARVGQNEARDFGSASAVEIVQRVVYHVFGEGEKRAENLTIEWRILENKSWTLTAKSRLLIC